MSRDRLVIFVVAALLAGAAFMLVGSGQAVKDRESFQTERAVRIGRAVAWAAAAETPEDVEVEAPLETFVRRLPEHVDGLEQVLVLDGVRFTAHSDPERAGTRLDRDSLSDKALYDMAALLRARMDRNLEERERRPELEGDAYAEYLAREREGVLAVGVPVKQDDRFEALVEVRTRPVEAPGGLPWVVLLLSLGAIVLFVPVAYGLHRAGAVIAVGGLLLGALLAAQAAYLASWRADDRQERAELEARTYGQLADAGLFGTTLGIETRRDVLIGALDRGPENVPRGVLLAIEPADRAEPAGPEVLQVRSDGYVVSFAAQALKAARARDLMNLLQWAAFIGVLLLTGFVLGVLGQLSRGWRSFMKHRLAYGYLSPAILGLLVLVFIPVIFGLVLGFMRRQYNVFEFAGLSNYVAILSDFDVGAPTNFYFTLGVTILWTVLNVGLHVSIGLFLALLLNDQMLKARGVFRVLLIVPWAVPNYITALIWKGMFHKQFGAVNFFLDALGFQPVAWFQSFWPAFSTNVVTNTWLGFPFMMVISLGALQSIPADLYEASTVDGAGRWQRFRYVTLPLLMPALVPAVIVGTVWTFNMFNIIYLVSGGAPNGATDILITEAFRWAFERDAYGYAAAYSTLIFLILLTFTLATNRITGATKGAFE